MNFKRLFATIFTLFALFSFPINTEAAKLPDYSADDIIIEIPVDDGIILYGRPPKPW